MGLEKMEIKAYKNNKYTGESIAELNVQINPASYSHNHTVKYTSYIPWGAANTTLRFWGMPPETISFDIYFDGTGIIEGSNLTVEKQLSIFKETCFKFNGQIHEPNYLIISWGSLTFKCKLTTLNVNYTLFKQNGNPLRAKASVAFEEAIDESMINKIANPRSPDLTHVVIVKEGDSLPLICNDIYGDSSYYLAVAKHNNIVNFRKLIPGSRLYMPPIK